MHSHTSLPIKSRWHLVMSSVTRYESPMGTRPNGNIPNRLQCIMKILKKVYGIITIEVRQISVNGMVGGPHRSGERGDRCKWSSVHRG